jgi:radical SAM superfamily enzyme YgiQ (UPF0313 family)
MGLARTEPLALELAAGGLNGRHEVRLLDMRIAEDALGETLLDFEPDLLATTAYTAGLRTAHRIMEEAKTLLPGIVTVIGGHHATLVPDDFAGSFVNFIVIGEGEESFPALVESLEAGRAGEDVAGIARPKEGRAVRNPPRPLADLDTLPLPRRSLTKAYEGQYFRGRWRPVASVYTSRGCPFRCRFCAMWKLYNGTYRMRSPLKVAEEIAALSAPFVDFADDNTLQDPRQSETLARALKDLSPRKTYKVYARADAVVRRPDLITLWREAGLGLALIGFEAFRDEDLGRIRKGTTRATNEKAMHILKDNGVEIAAYFLVHPDFKREDFRALSTYVESMDLREPVFTVLTPFPGTVFYEEQVERLTTDNPEKFDLMHAVLPTRLPLERFQAEFADLYWRAYGPGGPAEGRFPPSVISSLMAEQTGSFGGRAALERGTAGTRLGRGGREV